MTKTRIIRDIELKNVRLAFKPGPIEFNLIKDGNVEKSFTHTTTLNEFISIDKVNVAQSAYATAFIRKTNIQFVEENGFYKLSFDPDRVNTSSKRVRDLLVLLGNNPCIEKEMCDKLDKINTEGSVIYISTSMSIGVNDWRKAEEDHDHLTYVMNKPVEKEEDGTFYNLVWAGLNNDTKSHEYYWIRFSNNDTFNIKTDNVILVDNIRDMLDALSSDDSNESKSVQDFIKLDLKALMYDSCNEYIDMVRKRLDEAIRAFEDKIIPRDTKITLEYYLSNQAYWLEWHNGTDTNKTIWVLNTIRAALSDKHVIEAIMRWRLILKSNFTFDYCSQIDNNISWLRERFIVPYELINAGYIAPCLSDINIIDTIDNFVSYSGLTEYVDDYDTDMTSYGLVLDPIIQYIHKSMTGIKTEALRKCVKVATELRYKYTSVSLKMNKELLSELMGKYQDDNAVSIITKLDTYIRCIKGNLDTVDKFISFMNSVLNDYPDNDYMPLSGITLIKSYTDATTLLSYIKLFIMGKYHDDNLDTIFTTKSIDFVCSNTI